MSETGIRALLRSDVVRLVVVAALGAGIVLSFQALTRAGSRAASRPLAAAATVAPASRTPASAAGSARPAPAPGRLAAKPGVAAAAAGGAPPAPITPAALARLPAGGPGLAVVIAQASGPFAQQNRLIAQGATLAVDQLNARGGVGHQPVRIVSQSFDGLSPAAVEARLRAAGRGAVLVLPCDANAQSSLAAAAAPYRTLMLAPCDADPSLALHLATYWPVGMAGNDEAAGLAGFLHTIEAASAFVVDTPGLGYAAAMTRYFRAALRAKGMGVAGSGTVSLGLTAPETARLAATIRAAQPRPAFVFTALPPPYVNRLAAALARDGVHQPIAGTSAMDVPLTLASGTAALQNATFPSYGFLRETAAVNSFVVAYRKRYGLPVGSFPGLGYETIGVLEDALAKAGSTDPAAIERALAGGIAHAGVALAARSYRSGVDHNPAGTVSVQKIFGGAFLPLLTSAPSGSPPA